MAEGPTDDLPDLTFSRLRKKGQTMDIIIYGFLHPWRFQIQHPQIERCCMPRINLQFFFKYLTFPTAHQHRIYLLLNIFLTISTILSIMCLSTKCAVKSHEKGGTSVPLRLTATCTDKPVSEPLLLCVFQSKLFVYIKVLPPF